MSIENNIFNAVDIIVDRAIAKAGFDITVNATVIECIDQSIGKYKVKYQDSVYYATSDNASVQYNDNAEIYLLIPGGDFSKDKKILGTVSSLGANYINSVEGDEGYEYIGTNVLHSNQEIGLCSYKDDYKVLYQSESSESIIELDELGIKEYLLQATHLIVGAEFKTNLNKEQRNYGNYGLIFNLEFLDDASQQPIIRQYIVDVDNMIGQPYNLISYIQQIESFEINGANFVKLDSIVAFTKDFPVKDDTKPDDIFIRNFELNAAVPLSSSALDSYYLSLLTPQGTFFPETENGSLEEEAAKDDILTLEADIKIKGKSIDKDSHTLEFYWFVEHAGVNSNHVNYNKYGGQGWKCLNDSTLIQGAVDEEGNRISEDRVEWTPMEGIFEIKKSDCLAYQTKYKCVCYYNNTLTLEKEIIIKNYDAEYNIELISSNGTEFYYDQGITTLTCNVDNFQNLSYNYYWSKKNNVGNFETIEETVDENDRYAEANELKNEIEKGYSNETFFKNQVYVSLGYTDLEAFIKNRISNESPTYDEFYNGVVSYLNDNTITRLENNILHNLLIKTITNFTIYSCSVFKVNDDGSEQFIGNASIKILNTFEERTGYSLVIHNGTQVFKYDEKGLSPTHASNENPQEPLTLTFSLFDEKGNQIEEETIRRNCTVKWTIPTEETLLIAKIDATDEDKIVEEEYTTYTNTLIFDYDILSSYNVNRNRNNIDLEVTYKDKVVKARTNFTFLKEGDAGTNGTDYVCKIILNTNDSIPPQYPTLYFPSSGNPYMNYNIKGSSNDYGTDASKYQNWFAIKIWKTGEDEVEEITSGYAVEWSLLANKYTNSYSDSSSFSVTSDGVFTPGSYSSDHPANIVKAIVTIEEKKYYATLPVTTVKIENANFTANIKEGTGYSSVIYNSDGVQPKYDATNPFEIELFKKVNGVWVDISKSNSQTTDSYVWTVLGRIWDRSISPNAWTEMSTLKIITTTSTSLDVNAKKITPISQYDGYVVNGAIEIQVKEGSTLVARIHKPVHSLLNKYGFSALNDWDGNSIELGETNGGVILSPQIGAGKKNDDNTFTGVLMGAVQDPNDTDEKVGILGYSKGQRSIFLDSTTGKAEFGVSGYGQIILDPTTVDDDGNLTYQAHLKSGNYKWNASSGAGLLIDLTTPQIRFGNQKFYVSSDGHMTAKGGGSIAGWSIGTTSLTKDKVGMSSDSGEGTNIAFWAGNTTASLAPFRVNYNGDIFSTAGTIGGWNIGETSLTKGNVGMSSNSSSNTNIAFWAGDATASSAPFRVNYKGEITATAGTIGGWDINSSNIYTGSLTSSKDKAPSSGDVRLAKSAFSAKICDTPGTSWRFNIGSDFGVTAGGKLYCTGAYIDNATIESLKVDNQTLKFRSQSITYVTGGSVDINAQVRTVNTFGITKPNIISYTINGITFYAFSSDPVIYETTFLKNTTTASIDFTKSTKTFTYLASS